MIGVVGEGRIDRAFIVGVWIWITTCMAYPIVYMLVGFSLDCPKVWIKKHMK